MASLTSTSLINNGYVFIKDVYNKQKIESFTRIINQFLTTEHIYSKINNKQDFKNNKYYINNKNNLINSFSKMLHYSVPVINVRSNKNVNIDDGMIDIFNINRLIPNINEYFDISVIHRVINKLTNQKWELQRINLQLCNSVKTPNIFHHDRYEKTLKYCILLTDILDTSFGPPMFIKGSHIHQKSAVANKQNYKTFLGDKGCILISYQHGLHRKLPQQPGRISAYLVYNFVPQNRINRQL